MLSWQRVVKLDTEKVSDWFFFTLSQVSAYCLCPVTSETEYLNYFGFAQFNSNLNAAAYNNRFVFFK